jgi:cytochrome c oxidase subunit II
VSAHLVENESLPFGDPFGQRVRRWVRRRDVRNVMLIWLVLTVLLVLFSFVPARIMGPPASPTKAAVENTMTVFTLAASPVAALVWSIAIYSVIGWRHRGPEPPTQDGPALRSHGLNTVLWVGLSSVLCLFLLIWGFAETTAVASASTEPLVVDVTGQQWVWTFSYPEQEGIPETGIETDQLYLPVNRPVVFHVTSEDVVHSFWVVQMGIKVDANPGQVTQTSVTPTRLGTFDVRCAELCGLLHADMETSVHVLNAQDFQSWLRSNPSGSNASGSNGTGG